MNPAATREESATPLNPPNYEAACVDNQGYIPEKDGRLPPAYVEKSSNNFPPEGYIPAPSYPDNAAPGSVSAYPPAPPGFYSGQPMGYGPPPPPGHPQTTYVYIQPTPLTDPPNDYMAYSLFVTICCCWLVGLFAVARASECRTAVRLGNRQEAELKSRQARKYAHMALGLGIVSVVIAVVIFGLYYGMMLSRRY